MIVICVTNQKGGVGKTTTADALAAYLRIERKVRVLAVDLDPQCNLSFAYRSQSSGSLSAVLAGKAEALNAVSRSPRGDIIPGSPSIGDVSIGSVSNALRSLEGAYDYVVLDTPPTLSSLTMSALFASDFVIVPTSGDIFGLCGLEALRQTVESVREARGDRPYWGGVLLTRHKSRTNVGRLAEGRLNQWAEEHDIRVIGSCVRECVALREAQAVGESIFTYSPSSKAAKDYKSAFDQVVFSNQRKKL